MTKDVPGFKFCLVDVVAVASGMGEVGIGPIGGESSVSGRPGAGRGKS